MNAATKQILIAVAASAAAGGTAALVSYFLNRPKLTTGGSPNPNPNPNPAPPPPNGCPAGYHSVATGIPNFPFMCIQDTVPTPAPTPAPTDLLSIANQIAQIGESGPPPPSCPPRYHWGGYDVDNPNLPKCIPDCPPGSHWGGYDADNPNLPLCVLDS